MDKYDFGKGKLNLFDTYNILNKSRPPVQNTDEVTYTGNEKYDMNAAAKAYKAPVKAQDNTLEESKQLLNEIVGYASDPKQIDALMQNLAAKDPDKFSRVIKAANYVYENSPRDYLSTPLKVFFGRLTNSPKLTNWLFSPFRSLTGGKLGFTNNDTEAVRAKTIANSKYDFWTGNNKFVQNLNKQDKELTALSTVTDPRQLAQGLAKVKTYYNDAVTNYRQLPDSETVLLAEYDKFIPHANKVLNDLIAKSKQLNPQDRYMFIATYISQPNVSQSDKEIGGKVMDYLSKQNKQDQTQQLINTGRQIQATSNISGKADIDNITGEKK